MNELPNRLLLTLTFHKDDAGFNLSRVPSLWGVNEHDFSVVAGLYTQLSLVADGCAVPRAKRDPVDLRFTFGDRDVSETVRTERVGDALAFFQSRRQYARVLSDR